MDGRVRGPRVLESQDPSADLLITAVRTYLPLTIARTRLALAGKSEAQMLETINSALDKKELPALEAGAMSYMLSKQGYLGDQAGHFHPHLMFWAERTEPEIMGRRDARLSHDRRRGDSGPANCIDHPCR